MHGKTKLVLTDSDVRQEETTSRDRPSPAYRTYPAQPVTAARRRDRPVRVLWLIKGLGLGGAERLLCAALPYVDRERFEIEVAYFLPWKDALVPDIQRHGVPVTCFDVRNRSLVAATWKVQRFLREQHVDLVHTHLGLSGLAGRLAARSRGISVVHTEHGMCQRMHPLMRWANRLTLPWNAATIAVSDDVASSLNRANVITIPNGVACDELLRDANQAGDARRELGIPQDALVVGKVANLSPVKRHEHLIEAFAVLNRQVPNSRLLLVGHLRGRDRQLLQHAERLGVRRHVVITGPRTDVPQLVNAMDIFAMSSRTEGLPVSLLEAMALGKPVVCTAVGGIPGVVSDGREGILVPRDDIRALAKGLIQLAQDAALRARLAHAAAEKARSTYDVSCMVRQVEEVYRDVLRPRAES